VVLQHNQRVRTTGVTELRKRPRLPLSFPVFAHGVDADGKPFKELLTALNVSAIGMLALTSATFFPVGRLKIELTVGIVGQEGRPATRNINAQVVRMEHRSRAKLVGLKFERPLA
jgi:hypothetical protein